MFRFLVSIIMSSLLLKPQQLCIARLYNDNNCRGAAFDPGIHGSSRPQQSNCDEGFSSLRMFCEEYLVTYSTAQENWVLWQGILCNYFLSKSQRLTFFDVQYLSGSALVAKAGQAFLLPHWKLSFQS